MIGSFRHRQTDRPPGGDSGGEPHRRAAGAGAPAVRREVLTPAAGMLGGYHQQDSRSPGKALGVPRSPAERAAAADVQTPRSTGDDSPASETPAPLPGGASPDPHRQVWGKEEPPLSPCAPPSTGQTKYSSRAAVSREPREPIYLAQHRRLRDERRSLHGEVNEKQ